LSNHRLPVLDIGVNAITLQQATDQIIGWAREKASRYVCVANVHMVMEAHDDIAFRQVVNQADLVVPDGMPLVWMLRLQGARRQPRVYGPDLMQRLCKAAAHEKITIGLYGSTPGTLTTLRQRLLHRWPGLQIGYVYSPPFRPLTSSEEATIRSDIQASGVRLLFVALGCPRQEQWMAKQRGHISAVMVGVGAAFDFLAGLKPQAPLWMQQTGLEWLFRLSTEPQRLARRYLYHNPRFVALALRQLWYDRGEQRFL